jgi:hypothetical protein
MLGSKIADRVLAVVQDDQLAVLMGLAQVIGDRVRDERTAVVGR